MADKGKGKALDDGNEQGSRKFTNAEEEKPSFAARVANSASTLTSSLLNSSSGAQLTSSLSSSEAIGGKASNNSQTASTWTQNQTPQEASRAAPSFGSFRTPRHEQYEPELMTESDFNAFLDSTPVQDFIPQPMLGSEFHVAQGNVEYLPPAHSQYQGDGADVVALLDDPNLAALVDASGPDTLPTLYEPDERELSQHNAARLTDPTNLIPDAFNTLSAIPPSAFTDDVSRFEMLKEQENWIADWENVLKNYMRDVWTDLAPLVEAARDEVTRDDAEKPALQQLSQVFQGLRSKL
jgi:hypothetical protein